MENFLWRKGVKSLYLSPPEQNLCFPPLKCESCDVQYIPQQDDGKRLITQGLLFMNWTLGGQPPTTESWIPHLWRMEGCDVQYIPQQEDGKRSTTQELFFMNWSLGVFPSPPNRILDPHLWRIEACDVQYPSTTVMDGERQTKQSRNYAACIVYEARDSLVSKPRQHRTRYWSGEWSCAESRCSLIPSGVAGFTAPPKKISQRIQSQSGWTHPPPGPKPGPSPMQQGGYGEKTHQADFGEFSGRKVQVWSAKKEPKNLRKRNAVHPLDFSTEQRQSEHSSPPFSKKNCLRAEVSLRRNYIPLSFPLFSHYLFPPFFSFFFLSFCSVSLFPLSFLAFHHSVTIFLSLQLYFLRLLFFSELLSTQDRPRN